jgi:hypothetical protein
MEVTPPAGLRYALMQHTLEIPPVEKLRRAFESVPSLTAADAPGVANDAYGILVKNMSLQDATRLQQALGEQGIATELAPENLLPGLPATRFVRQAEFSRDALLIHDPMGRRIAIEWAHVRIIAVGQFGITRFERREMRPSSVNPITLAVRPFAPNLPNLEPIPEGRMASVRVMQTWVELILGQGAARCTFEIEGRRPLVFDTLGDRRTSDFNQDLALFVRELSGYAPQALMNRGAFFLREDPPVLFSYPTRNAFHEELIWMLWQSGRRL